MDLKSLTPTMKRNHEIRIRLSLKEKVTINRKSKEVGLSPSAYLRMLGLQSKHITQKD